MSCARYVDYFFAVRRLDSCVFGPVGSSFIHIRVIMWRYYVRTSQEIIQILQNPAGIARLTV